MVVGFTVSGVMASVAEPDAEGLAVPAHRW
jgi:hypothetical protein